MNQKELIRMFYYMSLIMSENKDYLIELDSKVGDGDLGLTMSDGFLAAYQVVKDSNETDLGKLLYQAGKTMSTTVPSTMGTLMASGFMQAGKALKGKTDLSLYDIANLFGEYLVGVANRGKAKIGEKTFLDGLDPAVTALKENAAKDLSIKESVEAAVKAAQKGFEDTTTMVAVHGRAATRGEASKELWDPGAAVAVLMMQGLLNSVIETE